MITSVFIWLSAIIVILLILLFYSGFRKRVKIARILGISEKETKRNHLVRSISGVFLIVFLSLGFLAPVIKNYKETVFYTSDVLFLIDESRSMAAEEPTGTVSRLERSKAVMVKFSKAFTDLDVSVYGFTREVRSHLYWTPDYNDFLRTVEQVVRIEGVPTNGTDLGKAIGGASNYFPDGSESKIIVLLSDGENNGRESDLREALDLARQNNVKIIAIGVGDRKGANIPIYNERGQFVNFEAISGKRVVTRLNENTLRQIAISTNGVYAAEENLEEALEFLNDNLVEKKRQVLTQDTLLRKIFLVLSLILLFFLIKTNW